MGTDSPPGARTSGWAPTAGLVGTPERLAPDAPLPTFVIIGAQKSATRWLRENLGLHPQVCTTPEETHYFSDRSKLALGPDWYRAQFTDWDGERVVGESCPAYLMWNRDPGRTAAAISDLLPDVRLLAILRNPVDRAESALLHHISRRRIPAGSELVDVVGRMAPDQDPHAIVAGGWYAASLEPYIERFGDQVLVLLHDDLRRDPVALYRRAAAHIGADASFVPPHLGDVVLSNRISFVERVRSGRSLRVRKPSHPLTRAERRTVYAYFRDDIARLETMIDRDLSAWDPDSR